MFALRMGLFQADRSVGYPGNKYTVLAFCQNIHNEIETGNLLSPTCSKNQWAEC